MTPLDGYTIAALIVIGVLLFLAGWRMGIRHKRRDSDIEAARKAQSEPEETWPEIKGPAIIPDLTCRVKRLFLKCLQSARIRERKGFGFLESAVLVGVLIVGIFIRDEAAYAGVEHTGKPQFSHVSHAVLVDKEAEQIEAPEGGVGRHDAIVFPVQQWNVSRFYNRIFPTALENGVEQEKSVGIVVRKVRYPAVARDCYGDVSLSNSSFRSSCVGDDHVDDDRLAYLKLPEGNRSDRQLWSVGCEELQPVKFVLLSLKVGLIGGDNSLGLRSVGGFEGGVGGLFRRTVSSNQQNALDERDKGQNSGEPSEHLRIVRDNLSRNILGAFVLGCCCAAGVGAAVMLIFWRKQ